MKPQVRILGIDDSPFKFGGGKSLVVGAVVRAPGYLEGLMRTEVDIDGDDATEKLVGMISSSRYREQAKAIMLDGIALAGFNVVDIGALYSELKIPVLTLTRDEPNFEKMRSALKRHFRDWERRYELITKHELRKIETEHNPIYASGLGLDWAEFENLICASTVRGVVPEPLRIAHIVSSAMVRGESYGRS
jgi:endonuclease V-like protein UPF0215 family